MNMYTAMINLLSLNCLERLLLSVSVIRNVAAVYGLVLPCSRGMLPLQSFTIENSLSQQQRRHSGLVPAQFTLILNPSHVSVNGNYYTSFLAALPGFSQRRVWQSVDDIG